MHKILLLASITLSNTAYSTAPLGQKVCAKRAIASTFLLKDFIEDVARRSQMSFQKYTSHEIEEKILHYIKKKQRGQVHGNWEQIGLTEKQVDNISSLYDDLPYINKVHKWVSENITKVIRISDDIAAAAYSKMLSGTRMTHNPYVLAQMESSQRMLNRRSRVSPVQKQNNYQEIFDEIDLQYMQMRQLQKDKIALEKQLKDQTNLSAVELEKINHEINTLTQKMIEINALALNDVQMIIQAHGVMSEIVMLDNRAKLLIKEGGTNKASNFYARLQEKYGASEISISLIDNVEYNSLGFFQPSTKRIEVGLGQAKDFLDETLSITGKHEGRHLIFDNWRANGKESIYHTRFHGTEAAPLGSENYYHLYMSAEEIYNHSTDIGTIARNLKRQLKNSNELNAVENLSEYLELIGNKAKSVKILANNTKTITEMNINQIDDLMDSIKNIQSSYWDDFDNMTPEDLLEDFMNLMEEKNIIVDLVEKNTLMAAISDADGRRTIMTIVEKEIIDDFLAYNTSSSLDEIKSKLLNVLETVKKKQMSLNMVANYQIEKTGQLIDKIREMKSLPINHLEKTQVDEVVTEALSVSNNVKEGFKGFVGL